MATTKKSGIMTGGNSELKFVKLKEDKHADVIFRRLIEELARAKARRKGKS